ncbi:MAG: ATP-binding protein [Limosilactobacillus sp.]|jgi:two-component system sensor histidine kinase YcbA|uniref:sensor histidine kinase n=1 Tax=Limosilactobacillus sp. TaxID=2773925 RepID=UPI0025BCF692|nr:ATP-binding protein [Limosilactobacillus sp.]MCI1974362.1 ATP-binding protein [Limosilactobacillus sp.]MCI2030549.1 ATP-binding protein [Limosilactobacillus sp.]
MLRNLNLLRYRKYQRIIIAAIIVALSSQIEVSAFVPGNIIALSAFILPLFLYFNQDLNPLQIGLAIAIASPVFRGFTLLVTQGATAENILTYTIADIIFFVCYSLIYYLLYWLRTFQNNVAFYFTIIICDYLSNLAEIAFLNHFHLFSQQLLQVLFLLALARATIAFILSFILHYFQLLTVKSESHERQYYHFIWVASAVKSEVYFMRKTIGEIEQVTKNAYQLNERLAAEHRPEEQKMAYQIAQNVHEIKHSYQNVIKGLGDYFDDRNNEPMPMKDILKIVTSYSQMIIREKGAHINLVIQNHVDIKVPQHYYLVTILSNLIINGIDAIGNRRNGELLIKVREDQKRVYLSVTDNGNGIPKNLLPLIFKSGFSTKFDASGDIYRGIGLSNVQTIVHEQFGGQISVDSTVGVGTTFFVNLNRQKLTMEGE